MEKKIGAGTNTNWSWTDTDNGVWFHFARPRSWSGENYFSKHLGWQARLPPGYVWQHSIIILQNCILWNNYQDGTKCTSLKLWLLLVKKTLK